MKIIIVFRVCILLQVCACLNKARKKGFEISQPLTLANRTNAGNPHEGEQIKNKETAFLLYLQKKLEHSLSCTVRTIPTVLVVELRASTHWCKVGLSKCFEINNYTQRSRPGCDQIKSAH